MMEAFFGQVAVAAASCQAADVARPLLMVAIPTTSAAATRRLARVHDIVHLLCRHIATALTDAGSRGCNRLAGSDG
jgi:hypothetical protein